MRRFPLLSPCVVICALLAGIKLGSLQFEARGRRTPAGTAGDGSGNAGSIGTAERPEQVAPDRPRRAKAWPAASRPASARTVRPACPPVPTPTLSARSSTPPARCRSTTSTFTSQTGRSKDYTDGPSCDTCADRVSGSPVTKAVTDASGTFHLGYAHRRCAVGRGHPPRLPGRQVAPPNHDPQRRGLPQTVALADPQVTRLPRDQTEGLYCRDWRSRPAAPMPSNASLKIGISKKSEFSLRREPAG